MLSLAYMKSAFLRFVWQDFRLFALCLVLTKICEQVAAVVLLPFSNRLATQ